MLLSTEGYHNPVSTGSSSFLDTCQDRREIIMGELRYDDTYEPQRHHPAVAQSLTDGIGIEVVFTGILLDGFPALLTDTGRILQCTGHRGHRDTKLPGNILHCHRRLLFHLVRF